MTCIVAFTPEDDVVYMVADKRTSGNNEYTDHTDKVRIYQHMALGISGDQRLSNLMQTMPLSGLEIPKNRYYYEKFVMADLLDKITAHLDANKYSVVRDEQRTLPNSQIVVALPGQIFSIHWDLSVINVGWRYWTAGSGGDYARGWIKNWYDRTRAMNNLTVEKAMRQAIKAAASFDPAVSQDCDFYILNKPLL